MQFKKPPIRFWIASMIFFSTLISYVFRSNMSVSIVKMVKSKKKLASMCSRLLNTTISNSTTSSKTQKTTDVPTYDWDESIQGQIIASYFYGYVPGCLPAGALAEYFGPWIIIVVATAMSIVLNALTPISAEGGYGVVCAVRAIIGFLGGLVYPAVNVLIARWAPPKEKSKFLSAMMGNTLGTVLTFQIVGAVTFAVDWHWGFYVMSIISTVYLIAFAIVTSDSPEKHRWITEEETAYILECQAGTVNSKKKIAPYKHIIKSGPFWTLCVAQWGNLWGLYLLLSYTPKYMSQVLGFNIKDSGFLSSLPNVLRLIFSFIYGIIGDYIRKNDLMTTTKTRKVFIVCSHYLPAVCLALILSCECVYQGPIALLVLSQVFSASVVISHLQNPQDLAPNFAGTVYGLMSFVGGFTGIIVPIVSGEILERYEDVHQHGLWGPWMIFLIGAVMFVFCGTIFILFGTAEVQPWNDMNILRKKADEPTSTDA